MKKVNNIKRIPGQGLLLVSLLMLLMACEEQPFYEAYLPVQEKGWHQDSTATFEVEISDTSQRYAIVFNLRANDQYPYANLYLFRSIESEEGVEYSDTANLTLADRYGKWLGEGVGALKTFRRPFAPRALRFRESGTYRFHFTQAMRQEVLPGVEYVGLSIYQKDGKANKKEK